MAQSNLLTRLLTAGIAGPLILLLLFLGPAWGWLLFVMAATLIGAFELYGMTHRGDRPSQVILSALTIGVMFVMWQWGPVSTGSPVGGPSAEVLLTLIVLLPIASTFVVLVRLGDIQTAALRVAAGAFGPLYLGAGLGTLVLLRRDVPGDQGPGFVLLSLVLSWFSDTGAYFAGRFLGKHKLYPAVSPKKTVEGAVGGLVFSVIGAVIGHFSYVPSLSLRDALILAIVAGGLGQAGDLGESLLKRSVGVKDSGGIVPGHGGILDRVDALLVTSTVIYLYVLWFRV